MKYGKIKASILFLGILASSALYGFVFPLYQEQVDKAVFKAFEYEKSGKIGNAIIEYLKAQKILEDDMAFSQEIALLVEKWKWKNNLAIGVSVLSDGTNEIPNNDRRLFADCVMENMFLQKPDIFDILESEKLNEILLTQKMILAKRSEIATTNFSKLKQINYLVFLSLLDFNGIEEVISTENRSKRYPLKEDKILNPDWVEADRVVKGLREQLDQEQRDLLQAKAANNLLRSAVINLAIAGTQSKLTSTESRRDKLQKYNDKITYDDWNYQIKHIKKKAAMTVGYNVISVASSRSILANQLERSMSYEDSLTENPNPAIGIPMNPLNLPTEEVTIYKLYSLIAFELTNKIIQNIQKILADRFLDDVKTYIVQGKKEDAIESYVSYLLFYENQWTSEHMSAQTYIETNKGFLWNRDLVFSLLKTVEKR